MDYPYQSTGHCSDYDLGPTRVQCALQNSCGNTDHDIVESIRNFITLDQGGHSSSIVKRLDRALAVN